MVRDFISLIRLILLRYQRPSEDLLDSNSRDYQIPPGEGDIFGYGILPFEGVAGSNDVESASLDCKLWHKLGARVFGTGEKVMI